MGGGKTYHPGLPPNNDGNMSWSLADRSYVENGDKAAPANRLMIISSVKMTSQL